MIIIFNLSFQNLLITLFSILTAIGFHNFGHAFIAYKLGDPTAKNLGKMTPNPFIHINIFGFLSMVLLGFGWASPIPVNRSNFKNNKKDFIIFSLSGIFFNFLVALFCSYLLKINFATFNFSIKVVLNSIITYNISFAAFNMLPIPFLDGWSILKELISYKHNNLIYQIESYSMFIYFLILLTNITTIFMTPIVSLLYFILSILS